MRWNSISLQGLLTLHRIFGTSCGVDWPWASCSRMSAGGALRLQVERSGHVKRRCFHQKCASSSSRAVQKGPSPVASPLKQSGCLLADPRYLCLPLTICDVAKMGLDRLLRSQSGDRGPDEEKPKKNCFRFLRAAKAPCEVTRAVPSDSAVSRWMKRRLRKLDRVPASFRESGIRRSSCVSPLPHLW